MKHIGKILFVLACAATISCATNRVEFTGDGGTAYNEKGDKNLMVSVEWLKNKHDTIDILATFKNNYDVPIVFKRRDMKLTVDGRPGNVTKNGFSGELAGGGGSEKGVLIFEFSPDVPETGRAILTIDNIKSEDGKKTYPPLKIDLPIGG